MLDQIPDGDAREIVRLCTCFNVRMLARLVTARYTEILRPSGLTPTQFSMLVALQTGGVVAINRLAEIVVSDRTTLSRNLKPMERDGLLQLQQAAEDARVREVRITNKGQQVLAKALPLWQQAQNELGQELWQSFHQMASRLGEE